MVVIISAIKKALIIALIKLFFDVGVELMAAGMVKNADLKLNKMSGLCPMKTSKILSCLVVFLFGI